MMRKITSVVASGLFALAMVPVNLAATTVYTPIPLAEQLPGVGGVAGVASTSTATPLGQATAQLVNSAGTTVATTTTTANGVFSFTGIPAGSYTVNIVQTFTVLSNGVTSTVSVIIGVQTVTVTAGTIAAITITTTASALAAAGAAAAGVAAAAAGSAGAALILTGSTAAALAAATTVAVTEKVINDASPSR